MDAEEDTFISREEIATELGPEALRRIDEATRKALEPQ